MSRVPRIRFKGFEEDWEQRKLGGVVGITSGFMSDFLLSDGKYHLTRIETIADGIVDENRVGYSNEKPDDMYLLKHGDILYSNINSISHMGKVAKYQGNSPLYHGINLLRLQPENNINSDFLLYLLNTEKCRNWAKTRANQAVSQASINQSLLTTQEIAISSFEEQKKIGDYFHNLDHLITLHQRKLEKLKIIKKSMLENLFPQNGEKTPKIRFSGFTKDWEQRKFDEVFDCTIPNNTLSRAELNYDSGSVRNVHYGDILIKYGSVVDVQNDEIPFATGKSSDDFKDALLQDGDIIIADTAEDETTGKACEIGNLQGVDVVSGLHTMVCRPRKKMALGYLGYYLNSDAYHHQLLPLMQGIKVLSLSKTNVQKTIVYYPKNKAEQELIAGSFRNLDNLITLHQSKLEKLQKIKKSMQESMFV